MRLFLHGLGFALMIGLGLSFGLSPIGTPCGPMRISLGFLNVAHLTTQYMNVRSVLALNMESFPRKLVVQSLFVHTCNSYLNESTDSSSHLCGITKVVRAPTETPAVLAASTPKPLWCPGQREFAPLFFQDPLFSDSLKGNCELCDAFEFHL
ncbi:hypothetical protein POM88_051132 [Heracleum sosnowskyi]|uniref:Uncharacterized protein n=1 Tax=Heracleum sosnowskyi TaxID=360622 RepID=A0AAD8GZZ5_9APIA|nr:hypothetical protein POM88_051132 [Heracleum sosnowskyi]